MKKTIKYLLSILLLINISAKADEGMWLLTLIDKNYEEMQKQGLKLSPEDIYNINHSSLKDAIVVFGGYCTGEIVSNQGLLFTNHHCGYSSIQQHSSLENDYLKDGFWAETKYEEIPTPGLYVDFLLEMKDVSERINNKITADMTEAERRQAINTERRLIIKEVTDGNSNIARVQSFFGGNNYYLLVYERYNDVRMVGVPPSSIGRFGHETDNWMWPRHTSDFCIFRVYMDKNGKPADYSEDNIPLVPKYSLPISLKGYEKGDFAMILGYPGSTTRYITSFELEQEMNINNKNVDKLAGIWLDIVDKDMKADDKVRIQYSSKQSRISNYWKMCIEQNKALINLKVLDQKKEIEQRFGTWLESDPERKNRYSEALPIIESATKSREELYNIILYQSFVLRGAEMVSFAGQAVQLYDSLKNQASQEEIQTLTIRLKDRGNAFYKDYNAPTDFTTTMALLEVYEQDIPIKYHPDIYKKINKDYDKFLKKMFKSSVFSSKEKFERFLSNPKLSTLQKDPAFKTYQSFYGSMSDILPSLRESQVQLNKGNRQLIAGILEMNNGINIYPDANSTMRLTYGTVGDYKPRDAVYYDYYTTMTGLMEKDKPGDFEFEIDDKIKELYNKKEFGKYGSDDINICFTTNNDITGGNSGSPVLNADGELIGLAFDGNSEAMSGDITFDPNVQKCINADIRYILFIIDKYAGAKHLIDEMNIVE